jgi:hypothetical protein
MASGAVFYAPGALGHRIQNPPGHPIRKDLSLQGSDEAKIGAQKETFEIGPVVTSKNRPQAATQALIRHHEECRG